MTEVSVSDVIVRVPKAGEVKWLDLGTYQKLGVIRIVLLREHSGERVLPIWIGSGEGDVIAMQLEGLTMERPSTFALTVRLIETGGMKLEKIGITALRGNVYYATMWLNAAGTVHEIDARPSDAITLALAMNAPIFVSEETWKEATSVSAGNEMAGLEEQLHTAIDKGRAPVEAVEMEYRSYRSLPRGEIPGIKPGRTEPAA